MPSGGYRDEYEAALHKAEALERENAQLRARLARAEEARGLVIAPGAELASAQRAARPAASRARMAAAWAVVVGVFTVLYYVLGGR
jgi:cell division septum initiation protein DivIVA